MKKILSLFLLLSLQVAATPNSIIAVVNDDLITLSAIDGEFNENTTHAQKKQLLDKQISLLLRLQKGKEMGVVVTPSEINTALNNIAIGNNLSMQALQTLPNFSQILEDVKKRLFLKNIKSTVTEKIKVSVSEQEVTAVLRDFPYTEQTKPEQQVKISQIVISKVEQPTSSSKTQKEAIQSLLLELKEKARKGSAFSALARLYSQDETNGSESAWMAGNALPLEFKKALSGLAIGGISQPFKIQDGWHIVKLVDMRLVDNYRLQIREKIKQDKLEAHMKDWTKSLRDKAYLEIFEDRL
jgi:parvulin-like peptidyl-prolyl isomerase